VQSNQRVARGQDIREKIFTCLVASRNIQNRKGQKETHKKKNQRLGGVGLQSMLFLKVKGERRKQVRRTPWPTTLNGLSKGQKKAGGKKKQGINQPNKQRARVEGGKKRERGKKRKGWAGRV